MKSESKRNGFLEQLTQFKHKHKDTLSAAVPDTEAAIK
jgi:hypothetical protein